MLDGADGVGGPDGWEGAKLVEIVGAVVDPEFPTSTKICN